MYESHESRRVLSQLGADEHCVGASHCAGAGGREVYGIYTTGGYDSHFTLYDGRVLQRVFGELP